MGARIRQVRRGLALTQSEFAHELGVDAITVSRWERNVSEPELRNLRKLAEISRQPISTFLELTAA